MTNRSMWIAMLLAALFVVRAHLAWAESPRDKESELARANGLWRRGADAQARGAYVESERSIREALAIRQRYLEPDHFLIGQAMNDLGAALYYQSKFTEAEGMYKSAIEIFSANDSHLADRAGSLGNLGSLYREQRKLADAEAIFAKVFEITKIPGAVSDLITATLLNDYGLLQKVKGNTEAAKEALEKCAAIRERLLPPGHAQVIGVWNSLGDLYYSQRQFSAAEEFFRKSAHTCQGSLGQNNRMCAPALNGLALTLAIRGLGDQSERLFLQALAIFEQAFGPDHPRVAAVLNNMGTFADRRGDFKRAEKYLSRALDVWTKAYGPEHPDVASSQSNLGSLYLRKHQFDKAEPMFQRALAVDEKIFGKYHDKVAVDLNNLAALYSEMKRYDEAEQYFERAIAVYEKLPKAFEISYAGLLANFAAQRVNRKMFEAAAPLYKRALEIYDRNPASQTSVMASAFDSYAQLMRRLQEPAEAQKAEMSAMRIRVRNTVTNQRLESSFAGSR